VRRNVLPRRHDAAADSGRMPCRSREPAAPLRTLKVERRACGLADRHGSGRGTRRPGLRMSPWEPPPRQRCSARQDRDAKPPPRASIFIKAASTAAEARRHGCRRCRWQDAFWRPLAAASASRTMRPFSGGDALDSALRGGGSRGRGECRIAGGGEGEGGESMPDAETSPLHPDEPPAVTSIEG
jgi:hypothetical protein